MENAVCTYCLPKREAFKNQDGETKNKEEIDKTVEKIVSVCVKKTEGVIFFHCSPPFGKIKFIGEKKTFVSLLSPEIKRKKFYIFKGTLISHFFSVL